MKKKIIGILVCILLLTNFFSIIGLTKGDKINENDNVVDEYSDSLFYQINNNCHVIKGVPYVRWETDFDCELCAFASIYLYLGVNYSYHDLFYLGGAGYSHAAGPVINGPKIWPSPPYKPFINPGAIACFWEQDISFMCNIFGLNYTIRYNSSKNIDMDAAWEEYWSRVKDYIIEDMPVWITINPVAIPWWREHFPPLQEIYENEGVTPNVGHVILLVGFNESNESVCYNDHVNFESPGYVGDPNINCHYIWMNISDLKDGTTIGDPWYYWDDTPFITLVLENSSKPALDKETAIKMVHSRNIEKMRGNKSAYDDNYNRLFKKFGIKALETFRDDLKQIKIIPRIIIWKIIQKIYRIINISKIEFNPFRDLKYYIKLIIKEKELTSNVLIKYANIYENCSFLKYDGLLLQNETNKWLEFQLQTQKLIDSFFNDSFVRNLIVSFSILKNMIKIVEDIIDIETAIISRYNNYYI